MNRAPLTPARLLAVCGLLVLILGAVMLLALSVGSTALPFPRVLAALAGTPAVESDRIILFDIRLPRVLLAAAVGAGLSLAGAVFQALLRNPLAEPYILGISSGGTAGTLVGMALAFGAVGTPLASFAGALAVMGGVYAAAHRHGRLDSNMLLLSGVMVGAFINAAILVLIALLHRELRSAFLWLMGNLSNAGMAEVSWLVPVLLALCAALLYLARNFNLIATGEETALQLGVDVVRLKRVSYLLASLVTGLVVSVSGVVGFVGLVVPHTCRLLFGPDHRLLLPASFLAGASFLIAADLVARIVIAPTELPVGAVTAAIGAPVFLYLLKKT